MDVFISLLKVIWDVEVMRFVEGIFRGALQSLLEAIDKIDDYSNTFKNADDFYHDSKSFDASMMQFVVIGEIVTRLDKNYKQTHSTIPWQKVKDFRNIIAHDYFGIDADEIWSIIQHHLLPLRKNIQVLIEEN